MALDLATVLALKNIVDSPEAKALLKGAGKLAKGAKSSGGVLGGGSGGNDMSLDEKVNRIHKIMVGDPVDYIVNGASNALSGIANFIGNKSVTDANRLAAAILAGSRDHSAMQDEIYGPSGKEKAAQMWAQNEMRKGENVKHATDQVSKVIDNLSDLYSQRNNVAKAMEAQTLLGAPGGFYEYANAVQRASTARR